MDGSFAPAAATRHKFTIDDGGYGAATTLAREDVAALFVDGLTLAPADLL